MSQRGSSQLEQTFHDIRFFALRPALVQLATSSSDCIVFDELRDRVT